MASDDAGYPGPSSVSDHSLFAYAFPGCLGIVGAVSRLDQFGLGPRLPFRPRDDPL